MSTHHSNGSVWAVGDALDFCRDVARHRARNFYYGLKISPEPQRSALFVVYAWMRAADDIVDSADGSSTSGVEARLQEFGRATDAALAGRSLAVDPLWTALAHVAGQFRLPRECFHAMLAGQLLDLTRGNFDTFEQLRHYCYRVASTVGLICIDIWGYDDPSARDLAIDRGIAFQLTNIIRDYKQDYDAGRIYLPAEDFQRNGIDAQALRMWSNPAACHAMMKQQIKRAESFYESSAALDGMISAPCRPTLWAMTSIYHGLLAKMNRDPSRLVLTKRLRLSAMRKGAIAVRAKWQARAARNIAASPVTIVTRMPGEMSGNTTA